MIKKIDVMHILYSGVEVDGPCEVTEDCGDNMGCAEDVSGVRSCFCRAGHVARSDLSCGKQPLSFHKYFSCI